MSRFSCHFEMPWLAFFVLGTLATATLGEEQAPQVPDQERIRGAWRVFAAQDEGRNRPKEIGRLDLFDTAKLHCIKTDGRRTVYRYELEPTAEPKRMILRTDDELITVTAIYKLEGDTLTVCSCYKPGVIPTDFETKLRDGKTVLTFKRDTEH